MTSLRFAVLLPAVGRRRPWWSPAAENLDARLSISQHDQALLGHRRFLHIEEFQTLPLCQLRECRIVNPATPLKSKLFDFTEDTQCSQAIRIDRGVAEIQYAQIGKLGNGLQGFLWYSRAATPAARAVRRRRTRAA